MLWDRGFWAHAAGRNAETSLRKGELKFTLAGEKLQGNWVLVRMRRRPDDKKDKWLLIKERDGYDSESEPSEDNDCSVASGRTMEQIAEGRGKAPKPFMLAGGSKKPDAVWHSKLLAADENERSRRPRNVSRSKNPSIPMPEFIPPQLCKSIGRPPDSDDWVHEIKFDGYRMQLRVENGSARLLTRKGLDWTSKFAAVANAAGALPDAIIDGEVVAINHADVPDFAALQAALSDGRSENLIYFAFDLLVESGSDFRKNTLIERKRRLAALLSSLPPASAKNLKYTEHMKASGDAVLQSDVGLNWKASFQSASTRPINRGEPTAG